MLLKVPVEIWYWTSVVSVHIMFVIIVFVWLDTTHRFNLICYSFPVWKCSTSFSTLKITERYHENLEIKSRQASFQAKISESLSHICVRLTICRKKPVVIASKYFTDKTVSYISSEGLRFCFPHFKGPRLCP